MSFAAKVAKDLVSVSLDNPHFVRKASDIVHQHGLVILKASRQTKIHPLEIKAASVALFEEYFKLATSRNVGIGKEQGFREFVIKDSGRYDVNMDHLGMRATDRIFTDSEIRMVEVKDYVTSLIAPVLTTVLGGRNFRWNALGNVISHPGTDAQRWHVDSSHLFQHSVQNFSLESMEFKEGQLSIDAIIKFLLL